MGVLGQAVKSKVIKGVAGFAASAIGGYKMGEGFAAQDGGDFLTGTALVGGSMLSDLIDPSGGTKITLNKWNQLMPEVRDEASKNIESLIRLNAILIKLDVPFDYKRTSSLKEHALVFANALVLNKNDINWLIEVWENLENKLSKKYDLGELMEGLNVQVLSYKNKIILSDEFDPSDFNYENAHIKILNSLISVESATEISKNNKKIKVTTYKFRDKSGDTYKYLLKNPYLDEESFNAILKKDFNNEEIFQLIDSPEQSNSDCFVVTATFPNSVGIIEDYRQYRDTSLRKSFIGRAFIKLYYKVGPSLASLIKHHPKLKSISKKILLKIHHYLFKK